MQGRAGVLIEKAMALTMSEFRSGIAQLTHLDLGENEGKVRIPCGCGDVLVSFEQLPNVRLGALELPRAKISFLFTDVEEGPRRDFLRAFDLVFQRGGG